MIAQKNEFGKALLVPGLKKGLEQDLTNIHFDAKVPPSFVLFSCLVGSYLRARVSG
jgi:hypothetical protein